MPAYIISSDNEKNVQLVVYLAKGLGLDVADATQTAFSSPSARQPSTVLHPAREAGKRRVPRPGSISAATADDLQGQLTQLRDEWNRNY